jgi:hypothetical protein
MIIKASNQTLDRMTRSAVSRMFQVGRHWRAPRHRSAFRWAVQGFLVVKTGSAP